MLDWLYWNSILASCVKNEGLRATRQWHTVQDNYCRESPTVTADVGIGYKYARLTIFFKHSNFLPTPSTLTRLTRQSHNAIFQLAGLAMYKVHSFLGQSQIAPRPPWRHSRTNSKASTGLRHPLEEGSGKQFSECFSRITPHPPPPPPPPQHTHTAIADHPDSKHSLLQQICAKKKKKKKKKEKPEYSKRWGWVSSSRRRLGTTYKYVYIDQMQCKCTSVWQIKTYTRSIKNRFPLPVFHTTVVTVLKWNWYSDGKKCIELYKLTVLSWLGSLNFKWMDTGQAIYIWF